MADAQTRYFGGRTIYCCSDDMCQCRSITVECIGYDRHLAIICVSFHAFCLQEPCRRSGHLSAVDGATIRARDVPSANQPPNSHGCTINRKTGLLTTIHDMTTMDGSLFRRPSCHHLYVYAPPSPAPITARSPAR